MPSKPTDPEEIRIVFDEHGTATLSGINYQDLRSILTIASLYNYEEKPKIYVLDGIFDDTRHETNVEAVLYRLTQRMIIDVLAANMSEAITPSCPEGRPAIPRILADYNNRLKTLDADVREMEAKAAEDAKTKKASGAERKEREINEVLNQLRVIERTAIGLTAKLTRLKDGDTDDNPA